MWLDKILKYKREELEHLRRKVSLGDVRHRAEDAEPTRDFLGGLRGEGTKIIAEIKKASPSAGLIRADFDPVGLAMRYEECGAAALSVLTDGHFFQGRLDSLEQIRDKIRLPLLRKDFVFDEYQILEARGAGADAVLLIARILESSRLKDYLAMSGELGMAALLEIHDERDLEKTRDLSAKIIGINNRDLDSLKTDLKISEGLAPKVPQGALVISESGISAAGDLKRLEKVGIHCFLVGETLLKDKDPGRKLREFLHG